MVRSSALFGFWWAVARRNLYIDQLAGTQTITEVLPAITKFRGSCSGKGWVHTDSAEACTEKGGTVTE